MANAAQHYTLADERAGYPATRAALTRYTADELMRDYRDAGRDVFGMFARNAAHYGNLVVDELFARGITETPNLFGPIPVRRFTALR